MNIYKNEHDLNSDFIRMINERLSSVELPDWIRLHKTARSTSFQSGNMWTLKVDCYNTIYLDLIRKGKSYKFKCKSISDVVEKAITMLVSLITNYTPERLSKTFIDDLRLLDEHEKSKIPTPAFACNGPTPLRAALCTLSSLRLEN